MTLERDNLKAGLFAVIGIILALVVIFTLSDLESMFAKTQNVCVYYKLSDGIKGLKAGASVTLGDSPVGKIVQIDDDREDGTGRIVGKVVVAEIPKAIPIFQNAIFELNVPPLGAGTSLNIRHSGKGERYDPSTIIPGTIARSELAHDFVQDMGIEDKQRQQVQQIIANVADVTAKLKEKMPALLADVSQLLEDIKTAAVELRSASASIKTVTADVKQRSPQWFDRIEGITERANAAMAHVDDLLEDKGQALRQTVDNVHAITATVREKTLAKVDEALTKATAAVENLKTASHNLKSFVVGQRPVLERAFANAQLTTEQLKLTAIEVRRSPWRILYKPKDKELETDNLYDASRSFALAAGSLDSAVASLKAVVADKRSDRDSIGQMLDHLEALFARYEDAENIFWMELEKRNGAAE